MCVCVWGGGGGGGGLDDEKKNVFLPFVEIVFVKMKTNVLG